MLARLLLEQREIPPRLFLREIRLITRMIERHLARSTRDHERPLAVCQIDDLLMDAPDIAEVGRKAEEPQRQPRLRLDAASFLFDATDEKSFCIRRAEHVFVKPEIWPLTPPVFAVSVIAQPLSAVVILLPEPSLPIVDVAVEDLMERASFNVFLPL